MKPFNSILLALLLVLPSVVLGADARPCVCDCIYKDSSNIRQPDYFDGAPYSSCGELDGKSCVGHDWAGTKYSGKLGECQDGPAKLGGDWTLENIVQLTTNSVSPGVISNLVAAVR